MTAWVLTIFISITTPLGYIYIPITISNIADEKSCHELAKKYNISNRYYTCLSYQGVKP